MFNWVHVGLVSLEDRLGYTFIVSKFKRRLNAVHSLSISSGQFMQSVCLYGHSVLTEAMSKAVRLLLETLSEISPFCRHYRQSSPARLHCGHTLWNTKRVSVWTIRRERGLSSFTHVLRNVTTDPPPQRWSLGTFQRTQGAATKIASAFSLGTATFQNSPKGASGTERR